MLHHTGASATNQYTYYANVISHSLSHACTYLVAIKNGVGDLCLYQLQCKCMCIPVLRFFSLHSYSMYVCITNKATYARSKHDDQDDN